MRQRQRYAAGIRVISTVRPTLHTNPSQKRNFSKTLLKPGREFDNTGFSFSCHFENEALKK